VAFAGDLEPPAATIAIEDCTKIRDENLMRLAEIFNRWGFVVIWHGERSDDPAGQMVGLGRYLGSTYRHNRADDRGLVRMAPTDPTGVYIGATSDEHPLHTDGAYDPTPPPLLALQAEVPASTGGLSTIVSAKLLHDDLLACDPEALDALFDSQALHVNRANQQDTKAVFKASRGHCAVVWRDDYTATFKHDEATQRAVGLVREFLDDSSHVVRFLLPRNHIILLDNSALLHGRTSFEKGDDRLLNRINFMADRGFGRDVLTYGFPR